VPVIDYLTKPATSEWANSAGYPEAADLIRGIAREGLVPLMRYQLCLGAPEKEFFERSVRRGG